jgi:amidohydrolase
LDIASVKKKIRKKISELSKIRQQLHQHAELAWEEYTTTQIIRTHVESMGYNWHSFEHVETGGYIDYIVGENRPFIGFRADIDALPIPDNDKLPYRSFTDGISHACGHDFHTTIGIGLAAILKEMDIQSDYNIRIIFQPAEEPIPSGASKLIHESFIKDLKFIFAIHVEPSLPVGTISFARGWVNAQSTKFEFVFRGKGGHSARPTQTQDLIPIMSRFVLSAMDHVNSLSHAESPSLLVFTTLHGGDSYNSIPREIKLTATLRTTQRETLKRFFQFLKERQKEYQEAFDVIFGYQYTSGAPPVVIKDDIYLSLKQIYNKFLKDEIVFSEFRSMGGDDFGWYLEKIPGALIRTGIQTESQIGTLHSPGFDVSEEALYPALLSLIVFILQWD